MLVLNIAEKPSVAKSISKLMSTTLTTTRGTNKYCSNIKFRYHEDDMIFTSVLGHLFHLNFLKKYSWEQIEPDSLFYEAVAKTVSDEDVKKNIEIQVRRADRVVIWTDCDREGENIAKQIENVVLAIKNIDVFRARFSGISNFEIQKSYNDLKLINNFEADAVDARMELDLKIGSAFTIFQTLCLRTIFNKKQIVSFGPCQIPTLGFVVERYEAIENHIEEKFWTLKLHNHKDRRDSQGNPVADVFSWKRERIFDSNCVVHFYNMLSSLPAFISKIEISPTTKLKPLPLRTVELQKICSSIFKVSSHKIMTVAEKLYNQGYISYPRTETDSFDSKFNFRNILENLKNDSAYSTAINQIEKNFKFPRKGKNNDMAHSPIYPLKAGHSLSGLDRSIYDFISRRFLGGLCDDAKGQETYYEAKIGREEFFVKSHKVLQKNYLTVYTYDSWPDKEVSKYTLNEKLTNKLKIEESKTEPPPFLTESDLIALMDKNGIGTDATIHEHIQKIQEREYARKNGAYIIPEKFGIALIRAYKDLELEFSGPVLRKDLELKLKEVCNNKLSKTQLVSEEIKTYHRLYNILKNNRGRFFDYISRYINSSNALIDNKKPTKKTQRRANNENIEEARTDNTNRSKRRQTRNNDESSIEILRPSDNRLHDKRSKENKSNTKRDEEVYCDCGKVSIESETKNGDNKGKTFYMCSRGDVRCNFFKWAEDKQQCYCGFDPIALVSKTENNRGRKFLKCKKAYRPCSFFKWEDSV